MPRLHQDDCRDGGGNSASRRSLTEFLGFEPPQLAEPAAASALVYRPDDRPSESEWRWLEHASPEAAQAPGALIPPACFPPALPTAFSSYSEMAQPGLPWSEVGHFRMLWSESTTEELADLVTSLKALSPLSGSEQLSSGPQPLSVPLGPQPRPLSPLAGSQPQPPLAGSQQQPPLAGPQGQLPLRLEQLNPWPERARAPRADDDLHFARLRRRASFCGVVSRNGTDILSWAGILPPRCADPSGGYSPKVFLGGLPWDITEQALMNALRNFQPIRVEWPGRDDAAAAPAPRGYAYVTFENEKRVRALLAASRREGTDWYIRVGTRRMRSKEVQVIPWALNDSSWVLGNSVRLRPGRTVFVGALHGMMSASALAKIMDDLFSGVVYAGIDTDKHKYPIGSGRVTFGNVHSYVRAISAAYVEIKTAKFTKRVQLNPYLEDSMCCSVCYLQQGPYFCREPTCFEYFCRSCWARQHSNSDHTPLMRTSRGAAAQARVTLPQNPLENAPAANGNHVPDADGGMPSPSSDNSESDAEQAGAAEQVLPENSWTERAAAVLPQDPSISEDNETGESGGSWAQSRGQ